MQGNNSQQYREGSKKDEINLQQNAQNYLTAQQINFANLQVITEENISQEESKTEISELSQSQNSQHPIFAINREAQGNIQSINSKFLLITRQREAMQPIIIDKPLITIGGQIESDVNFRYFDTNQLIFTVRNNKLFMHESASARYEASIKIKSSILYKGASFKIGKNSHLLIEKVYEYRSIELKIEPYMKKSIILNRYGGIIGRYRKNEIPIGDLSIGKIQAEIRCINGIWVIKNLNPTIDIFRHLHNSNSLKTHNHSPEIEVKNEDIIKLESSGYEIHVEISDNNLDKES